MHRHGRSLERKVSGLACSTEQFMQIFRDMASTVERNEEMLNDLDSTIGDAEHGLNLKRGFGIIIGKMDSLSGLEPAKFVKRMGTALAGAGCGSGPIFYGLAIRAIGDSFVRDGFESPSEIASAFEAGLNAIKEKGGADVGYKTMVDALDPAVRTFMEMAETGHSTIEALREAVVSAEKGMKATSEMLGKKGRGFHAGKRGLGHQDPGATSCYLLLKSVMETVSEFRSCD
jgi:dihydroxyacetone kinase-like protein